MESNLIASGGNGTVGIDLYGYVGIKNSAIKFGLSQKAGREIEKFTVSFSDEVDGIKTGVLNLSKSDIGFFSKMGTFEWTATLAEDIVTSNFVKISPTSNDMGDSSMGDMMQNQRSIITHDGAISFGFYDRGNIYTGDLTKCDQSYVFITPPVSNWMTEILHDIPEISDAPFNIFALAGAHNAGMNTVENLKISKIDEICIKGCNSYQTEKNRIMTQTCLSAGRLRGPKAILRSMVNFGMCQKDTITTMVRLIKTKILQLIFLLFSHQL